MSLPEATISIVDGGIGTAPTDVNKVRAIVGCCSSGTAGTQIYSFSRSEDVPGTLGYGPLAEAVAYALNVGGGVVYAVRATTVTASSASSVTHVGTGTGTIAVSGTPHDRYDARIEITVSGDSGVARCKYSLDGATTWAPEITVPVGTPGTYAIDNTGMTLQFTKGAGPSYWVDGDTYSFTTSSPQTDSTGLDTALDTLVADLQKEWRFVLIDGNGTPYSGGATTYVPCTTAQSVMTAGENHYRYSYAILNSRDIDEGVGTGETEDAWISSVSAGLAAFSGKRISLCGGHVKLLSSLPLPGKAYMRRPASWFVAAQRVAIGRDEDSGCVSVTGPAPDVVALYHDEDVKPGLDNARLTTARTIVGLAGYYCTHMRIMSTAGSDFEFAQHREIMDEACRAARIAGLLWLNKKLRCRTVAKGAFPVGSIDDRDALRVETTFKAAMGASIGPLVSGYSVSVDRTYDVLTNKKIRVTISIVPLGYAKTVEITIGYQSNLATAA